jgi:hypothetical protein
VVIKDEPQLINIAQSPGDQPFARIKSPPLLEDQKPPPAVVVHHHGFLSYLSPPVIKEEKFSVNQSSEYVEECGISPPMLPFGLVELLPDFKMEQNPHWGGVDASLAPPSAPERESAIIIIDSDEEVVEDGSDFCSVVPAVESHDSGPGTVFQGRSVDEAVSGPKRKSAKKKKTVAKHKRGTLPRRSTRSSTQRVSSVFKPKTTDATGQSAVLRSSRLSSREDVALPSNGEVVDGVMEDCSSTVSRASSVNLLLDDSDAELYNVRSPCELELQRGVEETVLVRAAYSFPEKASPSVMAKSDGRASVMSRSLLEDNSDLEDGSLLSAFPEGR